MHFVDASATATVYEETVPAKGSLVCMYLTGVCVSPREAALKQYEVDLIA